MNRKQRADAWARGERWNGLSADILSLPHLFPNAIIIESPKGSLRHGQNWTQLMAHDYGYIGGTVGADGDELDCFIGPNLESKKVFVVDQNHPLTRVFDEHKVMLGFNSVDEARNAYMSNYQDGWQGFGNIIELMAHEFTWWYKQNCAQIFK